MLKKVLFIFLFLICSFIKAQPDSTAKTKIIQNPSALSAFDIGSVSSEISDKITKTNNYDILLLIAIVSSGLFLFKNREN